MLGAAARAESERPRTLRVGRRRGMRPNACLTWSVRERDRSLAPALLEQPRENPIGEGFPPVWQVGQSWKVESVKITCRMVSAQTGQSSPVRPCTCIPDFFSFFSSEAESPSARAIAPRRAD